MMYWLKNNWNTLASKYCSDHQLIQSYWNEIESHYTSKNRHYHNFNHIYNMLKQSEANKEHLNDYDSVNFAIWYHDLIYKVTKSNNEEKSAKVAKNHLKCFQIDKKRLENIEKLIISTKKHEVLLSKNNDNSHLLDFDLAILGTDWKTYQEYIKNIRKEYFIYPDFLYNKGRKKVLLNFLNRNNLYFTQQYRYNLETKARENLKREIELL